MSRPVLLDLFCGGGGAAVGYDRAGFDVIGMDIVDQPEYPFAFERLDALVMLRKLVDHPNRYFAAVHASPSCKGVGMLAKGTDKTLADRHANQIPEVRRLLKAAGLPYVIENVPGSGVREDVMLCGEMFGLGVLQHRYFELGGWPNIEHIVFAHKTHRGYVRGWRHGVWREGPYVAAYGKGGGKATAGEIREAKGIDWMTDHLNLRDAIPPVYTESIGRHLMGDLSRG